ncbi:MAG TPA: hypothetical protein VL598_03445 [Trinickia sp.]|uniref:hypothetical protein n=1 Tax=Trinickia sp. TaxID=2571163 RepID=UPI002BF9130B|nr:hypothetical protein [Trinickia sp.]HTI16700.1 hypothetical protein [Trinickia sp.]
MTTLQDQAMSAAVQHRPRTMLQRILSHHEIATLLVLLYSPVELSAKPEIPMLQEAGLVEQISTESGAPRFQLTPQGTAILRGLGCNGASARSA